MCYRQEPNVENSAHGINENEYKRTNHGAALHNAIRDATLFYEGKLNT